MGLEERGESKGARRAITFQLAKATDQCLNFEAFSCDSLLISVSDMFRKTGLWKVNHNGRLAACKLKPTDFLVFVLFIDQVCERGKNVLK